MLKPLTLDKQKKPSNPVKFGGAERRYQTQLTKVAQFIGQIINGFPPGDPAAASKIGDILRRYADALMPWAEATAARMIRDVDDRDLAAWRQQTAGMAPHIRRELLQAPTGEAQRALLAEQVELIRSLPLEAAKRVHELTLRGIEDAGRAAEVAKAIQESGLVSASRARLIARTETARTASTLTEARAKHAGVTHYVWMTSRDGDVRHDHRILAGKVFAWDDPPVADQRSGARAHPGGIYNCRCWAKPIINE